MAQKTVLGKTILAVVIAMLMVPAAGAAEGAKAMRFGTSSLGSSGYNLTAGIANLVNKYTNIEASVIPGGGTSATIMMIGRGEREFGFGGAYDIYCGYKGEDVFAKQGPQPIRLVGRFYTSVMTIVAQPGIHSIEDFKNKVFMYRRKPNKLWGMYGDELLAAYGLSENNVRCKFSVQTKEVVDGLKTGAVDVGLLAGGIPMSFVLDLMQTKNYNIIGAEMPILQKMAQKYPFMIPVTIPAGTYKNQPKDIYTMGYDSSLIVSEKIPDEIVYTVIKTVNDHVDEFRKIHPLAKNYDPARACAKPVIPLHPGAVKFYKEIGVLK